MRRWAAHFRRLPRSRRGGERLPSFTCTALGIAMSLRDDGSGLWRIGGENLCAAVKEVLNTGGLCRSLLPI